jgi:hypothetical protein
MGTRRHGLPVLLAVALTAAPTAIADARGTPSTGDRWSPIDPSTLVSRVVVPPDALLASGAFRVANYHIQTLPWNRLPSNGLSLMRLVPPANSDPDGIPYKVVNGRNYYSPGNIAADGLRFVDSYLQTGNPAYLDRARVRAEKLREIGTVRDGALFVPYRFDYPNEGLKAPWVSGYSQGFALSLFVRLHRVTRERQYLDDARAVFRSFRQLGPGSRPWVSYVVRGELWLEEYPSSRPSHVLNGFCFAVFGLYDYERLTRDPAATQLLEGALSTVRHNAVRYRVPGGISLYDLVHRTQLLHYHQVVIGQVRDLGLMTRDPYFNGLARVLEADHG